MKRSFVGDFNRTIVDPGHRIRPKVWNEAVDAFVDRGVVGFEQQVSLNLERSTSSQIAAAFKLFYFDFKPEGGFRADVV